MKRALISLCLLAGALCSFAQTSKNVMYDCVVDGLNYEAPVQQKQTAGQTAASIAGTVLSALAGNSNLTKDYPEYAENVKQAIIAAVGSARRVRVVSAPSRERPVLTLSGTISSIKGTQRTHTWTDKDKHVHNDLEYSASVTGNITLKDASTGTIVCNMPISRSGYDWGWLSSSDAALSNAVRYVQSNMLKNMNLFFPLYANIVEGAIAKKDKQKEVYIDLGAPAGVYKGLSFYVYQVSMVAGKEAKREIGRIKVSEVMGDEISLCKVTKGGADIKAAIDAGTSIQIMSRE